MISLVCQLERRARPHDGGTRWNLIPSTQPVLDGVGEAALDLSLATVFVYDQQAAIEALRLRRMDTSRYVSETLSSASITVGRLGHFQLQVYLSGTCHGATIEDLDQALCHPHLQVAVHIGSEFDGSDRHVLAQWAKGTRFDQDHTIWAYRASSLDLVVARP
jgi:hypothetical protein